ncbi:hypothetical protein A3848_27255 [Paenibacillus sp. P32E]|nr:hypothetical protein A3848_27255 [Paenibacillus sp. P32E]
MKKLFPLKQRRGRNDCGKVVAIALVPGFSPRRRINKIWGQQRLEQRSVRGASTQGLTLILLQNKGKSIKFTDIFLY